MALTSDPTPPDPAQEAVKLLQEDGGALYRFFEHWWLVLGGVALLALAIFLLVRWLRRRPAPPPPSARAIALRELEKLRAAIANTEPFAFSVAVSDVLRAYVAAHFGMAAREQTSPEFLASIATSPKFSEGDRTLLEGFLERADLIKFARVEATRDDSEELLGSASRFVQGERA